MQPNRTGASHGENPARPSAVPAATLSMLSGIGNPNLAHLRSGSARFGEITALTMRNSPYAPSPIMATVSENLSSLSLRKCPMRIPTTGATPSQTPKMADVLTDVRKGGLSPPSTSELRKLSRLRTNPSVSSPSTNESPPGLRVKQPQSHSVTRFAAPGPEER